MSSFTVSFNKFSFSFTFGFLVMASSFLISFIRFLLLFLYFHSVLLVFGCIPFHLLSHSLPIWMGILPSWIHQFHKRFFEVSWSDPPVFPLVIFDYNEPLYGWRQRC